MGRIQELSEFESYLLNGINFRGLTGEDELAYCVRTYLTSQRIGEHEKSFNLVWFHVANEVGNRVQKVFGAKLKAMGKLPGVADFVFVGPRCSGFLELKVGNGKLSKNQQIFQDWCGRLNIRHQVARNSGEAFFFIEQLNEANA